MRKPLANSEFCSVHAQSQPYGRCDNPLDPKVEAKVGRSMKRKSRTPKNRWYCRYFMFKQAQATWNLDNVEDLTDEQYVQCLDAVHELLTHHVPQRKAWKLQPNEGPEDAAERDTPKALYSGEPMRYKNYSYRLLCYFVEQQQPGATPLSCSERVFEDALQQTNEGCHNFSAAFRQRLTTKAHSALPSAPMLRSWFSTRVRCRLAAADGAPTATVAS